MAKLEIVGVGPGSADYVTGAAKKAVQNAELVIGAQRSLSLFVGEVNREQIVLTAKNLQESLKKAAESVKAGKMVVLLSTGDPGFSGLLNTALKSGFFTQADIHVVPGVSAIQACASCLGISWDNIRLFTFHGGNVSDDKKGKLVSAYKCGQTIMLLPAPKGFAPKDIAALLLETGADGKTKVYVCENVTLENEKITETTLEDLPSESFGSLCVMVIKQTA